MYDINFFKQSQKLKERIVSGVMSPADIGAIEQELELLRDKSPHVFNIETTNHCNMTCQMCPRTSLMSRENQWIDSDTFESVLNQMTPHSSERLEDFWAFIDNNLNVDRSIPNENTFYFNIISKCVILHGYGEPLIDKNIVERVRACSARDIPTYFSCVPANISVKRAEAVMDAGLTVLKFSIDALDDLTAKKIRGRHNNFQSAYETILEILEMKKQKGYDTLVVPTMIAFSEDQEAREMHREFVKLWKNHDVFAYVKSQDNRWYFEDDAEMENLSHYAQQYCEYPWTSMTVMADGSAVPCTQDYDCEMTFGNVKQQSLETIWNGNGYNDFRRWHITGDFPKGHKCVERCDQVKLFQRLQNHPNVGK